MTTISYSEPSQNLPAAAYPPNDGNYSFLWANYPPRSWASADGADADASRVADVDAPVRTAPGHRGGYAADAAAPPGGAGVADADADASGYADAAAGGAVAADADADEPADDDDGSNAAPMSLSLFQQLLHCG